ncbi:thioredoxin family protein [Ectothiorhodospira variabilis]|uniref:thioredoxin family protein n=1 Tax=Ectothiorhodospira variabilis TaxID=505694 RepID=UPI001EFAB1F2|nr:thioredoxin family protein [Ectothiorhodospira variabilis]MCG5497619.1 thioredoxin family protein [Ectothiorhodospira variabilis]
MRTRPPRTDRPSLPLIISLLLTLALVAPLAGQAVADERDPYEHFFRTTFGDFQEELELARDEGKKAILIFFEMDACPFCHRMKDNILNQRQVQEYFNAHFASFSVDVEGAIEITDFEGNTTTEQAWAFEEHGVRATPVFQFFNLDGEPIARLTGPTSSVEEFIWLGEYVEGGHYEDLPFSSYRRERQQEARGG